MFVTGITLLHDLLIVRGQSGARVLVSAGVTR